MPKALFAASLFAALVGAAHGQAPKPAEAQLGTDIDAALLRLSDRLTLGAETLEVTRPARTYYELGAVVDLAGDGHAGLPVLAVTPGGAAERLGLRAGDRVLELNNTRFEGRGASASAVQEALSAGAGRLQVQIARGGQMLLLRGELEGVELPAYRLVVEPTEKVSEPVGCGRISTFDVAPRHADLYRAYLITIDGRLPGPTSSATFRVPAGRHVLRIGEAIDQGEFTSLQLHQRSSRMSREPYKTIELTVEADTTYLLAARLVAARRNSILDGSYWEPVIYQEVAENCR